MTTLDAPSTSRRKRQRAIELAGAIEVEGL